MNKESNNVLVVGAGISGIASALELANSGINVYLLEKEAVIGGHSASFCCKATDVCSQCSACVVPDKIKETVSHPQIRLLTNSTIRRLSGELGNFRVTITQKLQYIDQERCIACGLCTEVCPTDPKAIHPSFAEATPFSYVLDEELCLRFKGEKCDLCRKGCPTKAIKFKGESKEQELSVGALIVATGFDVFDARKKGSLGYGRYPNVLTGLDLEQIFTREGCLKLPASGVEPRNIAFIQCVGSRDEDHDYCSHVCCKYAMKLSGLIKYHNPDARVTIFYIDLQTAGKGFAQFYEEYKENIRFVRGVPVEILQTASGELEVRFEDISQGKVCRDTFELVVLSVGISPSKESWDLARTLGINLSDNGFFAERDSMNTNETNIDGIFIAGTCQGPKDIPDSIAHGIAAASKARQVLTESASQRQGNQGRH
ncbi:MAG: CoB--CoM heterodisulfide reductase iron-sulfur subunit A family protein [Dehalococcoidia bacterium]|nr:CoB--CoM heterodisulfide reductase iron-sulfur subunit A family protein [Dehalococcoidia bacterium]